MESFFDENRETFSNSLFGTGLLSLLLLIKMGELHIQEMGKRPGDYA